MQGTVRKKIKSKRKRAATSEKGLRRLIVSLEFSLLDQGHFLLTMFAKAHKHQIKKQAIWA